MIDAVIAVTILSGVAVICGCAYVLFVPPVYPKLDRRDWPGDE